MASRQGYIVCVNYNQNSDSANKIVTDIKNAGGLAYAFQADISNEKEVENLFELIDQRVGKITALVNNAGIGGEGPVEEVQLGVFRKVMETNFFGALRCTQAVLPGMRQQRSGHIVNISSIAGRIALAPQAAYAGGWRSSSRASLQRQFSGKSSGANGAAIIRKRGAGWPCSRPLSRTRTPRRPRWSATG